MKSPEITAVLSRIAPGQPSPIGQLMPLVYDELKALAGAYMRRENRGHTLQPTALVHEAFLRMVDQSRVDWRGKTHFLAVTAQMMRRILVDHARTRLRQKRGGGRQRVELHEDLKLSPQSDHDLLAVDQAIADLAERDPRQAQIVELRFFGGLSVAEVAEALGISKRTVEAEWTMIRAWFRREFANTDKP